MFHARIEHGHVVLVESEAGVGSGFTDAEYAAQGCRVLNEKEKIVSESDMIVKVNRGIASNLNRDSQDLNILGVRLAFAN